LVEGVRRLRLELGVLLSRAPSKEPRQCGHLDRVIESNITIGVKSSRMRERLLALMIPEVEIEEHGSRRYRLRRSRTGMSSSCRTSSPSYRTVALRRAVPVPIRMHDLFHATNIRQRVPSRLAAMLDRGRDALMPDGFFRTHAGNSSHMRLARISSSIERIDASTARRVECRQRQPMARIRSVASRTTGTSPFQPRSPPV
jgi:hypothetical protein